MIQSLMLVSLGFFTATLLALLIAPAAWARAVRLTSHRIRASLPINETEIRAEKDQLRATHALVVHQLEKKIERAEMSAARQRVELNRRDGHIADLSEESSKLAAQLDENRNARHVLAQTLNERLPRAEERLRETRELLQARDSQVAKFVKSATQQHIALAEASAQIRQQEDELKRLQAALMARQYAVRRRVPAESLEQTAALQSEVLELRERTSSQARLIERIQEAERTQLQDRAAAAEQNALGDDRAAQDEVASSGTDDVTNDDAQQGFVARFNRWRVALQKEKETTARLRAELANAHDRAAKQSAHYRDELRDLSQSGVVSVPLPAALEARAEQRATTPADRQTTLLSRAGISEVIGNGAGTTSKSKETGTTDHGNGSAASADAEKKSRNRDDTDSRDADSRSRRDAGNGAGQIVRRNGSLTERIKQQSESSRSQDDEKAETSPVTSAPTRNSGTLLQRLKGLEEA